MSSPAVLLTLAVLAVAAIAPGAVAGDPWQQMIGREVRSVLSPSRAGGIVVGVLSDGHVRFFSEGLADRAERRAVTPDSLFNIASLRKPFEAILLAKAVDERLMAYDDPVSKYVPEVAQDGDIGRVTVGQLATHTSGLLLPQDHPPWPTEHYTLASFLATLNAWQADPDQQPGQQHMYTHAGYVLLQLALERGLGAPIDELVAHRILEPLGMASSLIPLQGPDGRAELPPALMRRAVQGYAADGRPIGKPGDQQTYYDWPGTGQMFSTARDLVAFLQANLGETPAPSSLAAAMHATRLPAVAIAPHHDQALAWEINTTGEPPIVEKNGGLNNASSYMAIVPARRLGIVVLTNRGDQDVAAAGRRILRALPGHRS